MLIGPKEDPAGIKGMKDVAKAFQIIKEKQACFVSRGDHSGTHIAELNLWKAANTDIEKGAALGFANASNCYVLSDRGTWIHFKNKGDLQILVEGDKRMLNQYGVMLVNPAKHPDVKRTSANNLSTGSFHQTVRKQSPITRSTVNNYSIPMLMIRTHNAAVWPGCKSEDVR